MLDYNELIVKQSIIDCLKVYIQEKHKQGYNYLDIAKEFRDKGNITIINDDVFLVFFDKEIVIIFEHTSFEFLLKI